MPICPQRLPNLPSNTEQASDLEPLSGSTIQLDPLTMFCFHLNYGYLLLTTSDTGFLS